MVTLEDSRVACLVGQNELEAVSVDVAERHLRARVGAFLADKQAASSWPAGWYLRGRDLRDPGALTRLVVAAAGATPAPRLQRE